MAIIVLVGILVIVVEIFGISIFTEKKSKSNFRKLTKEEIDG